MRWARVRKCLSNRGAFGARTGKSVSIIKKKTCEHAEKAVTGTEGARGLGLRSPLPFKTLVELAACCFLCRQEGANAQFLQSGLWVASGCAASIYPRVCSGVLRGSPVGRTGKLTVLSLSSGLGLSGLSARPVSRGRGRRRALVTGSLVRREMSDGAGRGETTNSFGSRNDNESFKRALQRRKNLSLLGSILAAFSLRGAYIWHTRSRSYPIIARVYPPLCWKDNQ